MIAGTNQIQIFLPVLAIVALSIVGFLRMAVARGAAAKARGASDYYRAFLGESEPEYAVVAVRHYGNLFEAPVLFYAGCITAYAIGTVSTWVLVWAWGFVALRLVQSAVHLTINNPVYRGLTFSVSWLFLIALWLTLALAIFARL